MVGESATTNPDYESVRQAGSVLVVSSLNQGGALAAEDRENPASSPATAPDIVLEEEDREPGHRTRFLILGAVVVLALGYMIYAAFPGNALYFLTVGELMGDAQYRDGQLLRVSGKLVEGSFQRDGNSTLSHFQLADEQGSEGVAAAERLSASYVGVMPDLFFNPHSEIILQGSYGEDNVFEADAILVKCPSKYRALEQEQGPEQSG